MQMNGDIKSVFLYKLHDVYIAKKPRSIIRYRSWLFIGYLLYPIDCALL